MQKSENQKGDDVKWQDKMLLVFILMMMIKIN